MMCLHIKVTADLSIDEYTVYVYKYTYLYDICIEIDKSR